MYRFSNISKLKLRIVHFRPEKIFAVRLNIKTGRADKYSKVIYIITVKNIKREDLLE